MAEIDWTALGDEALELLRGELDDFLEETSAEREALRDTAQSVARYWQRQLAGDEAADELLALAKSRLELLVASQALEARRSILAAVERVALIGGRVLGAALKGAL